MAFEIIENISRADIAFRVRGRDLEELFIAGSRALIAIMMKDLEPIEKKSAIHFNCEADDIELLYYDFLSEFIFYKDSEKLLLLPDHIVIQESPNRFHLTCSASGEMIDRTRHLFSVDIKAVTMHNLAITQDDSGYSATIVVDV